MQLSKSEIFFQIDLNIEIFLTPKYAEKETVIFHYVFLGIIYK